jgi:hypothetical protein
MSNVLIGIIGVILFIGLALAGALFLGSRFQNATSFSKAAAVNSAIADVVRAENLYELSSGKPGPNGLTGSQILADEGYLKAVPPNPVTRTIPNSQPIPLPVNGQATLGLKPDVVIMYLGADAKDVCIEIEKQAGSTERLAVIDTPYDFTQGTGRRKIGCHYNNGTLGTGYMAYAPL